MKKSNNRQENISEQTNEKFTAGRFKYLDRFVDFIPNTLIASSFSGVFFSLFCVVISENFENFDFGSASFITIIMYASYGVGLIFLMLICAFFSIVVTPIYMLVFDLTYRVNVILKCIIYILVGFISGIIIFGSIEISIYLPEIKISKEVLIESVVLGGATGVFGSLLLLYLESKTNIYDYAKN